MWVCGATFATQKVHWVLLHATLTASFRIVRVLKRLQCFQTFLHMHVTYILMWIWLRACVSPFRQAHTHSHTQKVGSKHMQGTFRNYVPRPETEPDPEPGHGRTCHGQASQSLHKINKISDNTRAHTHTWHTHIWHTQTTISRGYFHQKRQKNQLKISSRPTKARIAYSNCSWHAPSPPSANHHSSTRFPHSPFRRPLAEIVRRLNWQSTETQKLRENVTVCWFRNARRNTMEMCPTLPCPALLIITCPKTNTPHHSTPHPSAPLALLATFTSVTELGKHRQKCHNYGKLAEKVYIYEHSGADCVPHIVFMSPSRHAKNVNSSPSPV